MTRAELFASAGQFLLAAVLMTGATLAVAFLGIGVAAANARPFVMGAMFLCFILAGMGFAGAIYMAVRAMSRSASYDPIAAWRADQAAWLKVQTEKGIRRSIELHDSTLTEMESRDGGLVFWLDAYVHCSIGEPGHDPGTGSVHRAELQIDAGRCEESLALPADILGGTVQLGAHVLVNVIPLPVARRVSVRLEFEFANEQKLIVLGEGLAVTLMDRGRYVEDFSGLERRP